MLDVLIVSVPSGILNRPPAAPAVLKACAMAAGFSARTQDLSMLLYDVCDGNYSVYQSVNQQFEPLVPWHNNQHITDWLHSAQDAVAQHAPKYLAVSVFSEYQLRATVMLCEIVKRTLPTIKIIVGGYGIAQTAHRAFSNFHTWQCTDSSQNFGQWLLSQQLADHAVYGEGESQICDVLAGKLPSANPVNLGQVPPANFDDYALSQYLWHTEPVLTVTGSKGCVRRCTFCNVPQKFGQYRRKTGQQIAQELISLSSRYNVYKFEFTDSLVNGSQRDFEEFITAMSAHNAVADRPIAWYGQYICRPQAQIKSGTYQLIKQSGACNLIIGAESGSDEVLLAMNKKQTVQDIFDELAQFDKHGLQATLLIMAGFYNETWPRFLETLNFMVRCHRYLASGVISRIAVGLPLFIEQHGYLHTHAEELGIVINPADDLDWTVKSDPSFTYVERFRRRLIAQAVMDAMGVSLNYNSQNELQFLKEYISDYEQRLTQPNTTQHRRVFELRPH